MRWSTRDSLNILERFSLLHLLCKETSTRDFGVYCSCPVQNLHHKRRRSMITGPVQAQTQASSRFHHLHNFCNLWLSSVCLIYIVFNCYKYFFYYLYLSLLSASCLNKKYYFSILIWNSISIFFFFFFLLYAFNAHLNQF